jgi:hypothetical protein
LGRFSFDITPRILENGSVSDYALGYRYAERASGDIRFRHTKMDDVEPLYPDADASLVATDEKIYEIFLLPANFTFLQSDVFALRAGAGAYYEFDSLAQDGYFHYEALPPSRAVNSYQNDFSMHLIGPLLDAAVDFKSKYASFSLSFGIVPVFFMNAERSITMKPYMEPHSSFSFSQKLWGSPYIYLDMSAILFKYLSIGLAYEFTRLNYKIAAAAGGGVWTTPEQETMTHTLRFEAALALGGFRIGYGYIWDAVLFDDYDPVKTGSHCLIIGYKKFF